MKRLTKGIHHIALKCISEEHFKETVHFYHDLYGMEIVRTWTTGGDAKYPCVMLDTGAGVLEICANGKVRFAISRLKWIVLTSV